MDYSTKPSPQAASLLRNYYAVVKELGSYLEGVLELPSNKLSAGQTLFHESDSPAFHDLLRSSFVCTRQNDAKRMRRHTSLLSMREILDEAQTRLFKQKRANNIITLGYRLATHAGDSGRKGMARVGITNHFLNTVITAFQAPDWEALLERIGEDAMLHLLMDTSIFIPLPNGCLCQLTGEPALFLAPSLNNALRDSAGVKQTKRPHKDTESVEADDERPKKRRKLEKTASSIFLEKPIEKRSFSPADIAFARVRLFYSRPNYIPHTNLILVGFPLRHIFNRICPSYPQKDSLQTKVAFDLDNPRENGERVRHLSKYVFARQYGLNSPFYSRGKATAFSFGDYIDREMEIKTLGATATPKRLQNALPLLEKMIRRHSKCGYVPLRDITCPSKVKNIGAGNLDSTVILEMISETSIQLRSQISLEAMDTSLESSGNRKALLKLSQGKNHGRLKPRFVEFSCSYVEVYRFVALVTKTVIPNEIWGSKGNLNLVLHHAKQFITCRRYETLTLHYVLQNFSTTACDWLCPPSRGPHPQTRAPVSDSSKRRELLEDFLFWYFDSFVLPLIKTTFYVTESSAFRNQILYFRHDDWNTLCTPLIERLTSVTFEKLSDDEASEIIRQRRLGFSFVRLLPKETGVRPIVNLRRRKTINKGSFSTEQSINQVLQAAFSILTYERSNQPQLLGASIFSPDDIYFKLKKFKAALPRDTKGNLPKLYFVKVDVQACFDTIEQTKLLQILRDMISEDVYMIQKYGHIRMSNGKVQRSYVKKAIPEDDHPHFLRYAADLAGVLRNTIFVDQVLYPLSKKQELLHLLEEHITENIVKIGQSYYRQMVGIPQGSVLSSLLCSFFYGDLEKKFSKYLSGPSSVLLRLIDDYLFVTTSLTKAREFLDMMKKGHPEYGCFISQDKTLANFDHEDTVANVIDIGQTTFPWCGYAINMRDLSIGVDYSRYHGSGLRCTLTVDRGRRPGVALSHKIMQLAKAKSHAIYSDRELNTEHVIYLNIYQNFLLTAMKMHAYLRDWGTNGKRNNAFLCRVVKQAILFCYTTVRAQTRRKAVHAKTEEHGVRKEAVMWLGRHAFYHVFSRYPAKYKSLVFSLSLDLKRLNHMQFHRRFKTLVREGQAGLAQIAT